MRRSASTDKTDAGTDASTSAHEAEIGRILFDAMSQLRGTALKAAQVLSLDAAFLPTGVRAELARATHQAVPLNRALVGRVFRQSFGCEPEALFKSFEPTAFAAASLGQVHRATLGDGAPVAVKIQYPGIAATIDTDMHLLRKSFATMGRSVLSLPDAAVVDQVLDDIQRQLHEEVDYEGEAQRQRWFSEHTFHEGVVMAEVITSHSNKTVLTQELLPGSHVDPWMAGAPSQALRDRQGQAIFDWFIRCVLEHGRIQCDLHPGNFLFMPDGRVGVIDFGCTRALSAAFVAGLSRSWCAWLNDDASGSALYATYQALGMVRPGLSLDVFNAEVRPSIEPVLRWATQPFQDASFDFAQKSQLPMPDGRSRAQVTRHMAYVPPEMLSMDRAWLGLMHLLKRLGARVETRAARQLLARSAERPLTSLGATR